MKKLLFVAVLGMIAFSSCKKEKDCECVTTTTSPIPGITIAPSTLNKTIEDGECSDMDVSTTNAGMTAATKCTEK